MSEGDCSSTSHSSSLQEFWCFFLTHGHLWSFVIMRDHSLSRWHTPVVVTRNHFSSLPTTHKQSLSCIVIRDHEWPLMVMHGHALSCIAICSGISNTANNLFLYVTYRFFSLAYQTLITIFGSPTFIYSRHGFYKYVLFSFFHLFLQKSIGKGTEKYFPLTLMQRALDWRSNIPTRVDDVTIRT